jgi:hypothetical protein
MTRADQVVSKSCSAWAVLLGAFISGCKALMQANISAMLEERSRGCPYS